MSTLLQDAPAASRQSAAQSAFRALLVHVQEDHAGQTRLDSAAWLARKLDATLVGVGAEGIDPMVYSDGYGLSGGWISDLQAAIAADLQREKALFEKHAGGVKHRWESLQSEPLPTMAAMARNADLIVASAICKGDHSIYRSCDTGELVITSGRPVLIVPEHGGRLQARAVVVAWKDSRESRRALADALPFLKDAEDVLILEACTKEEVEDAEARTSSVVDGLKRHGVAAKAAVRVTSPAAVAVELHAAADAIGADLIVAGGYGHSRLGEWVFGGVTRDLLRHPGRFALLSH